MPLPKLQSSSSDNKYRALLVNDDGYKSGGIRALYAELSSYDTVAAVAPDSQQSWKGKSITGHQEFLVREAAFEQFSGHIISGTPADCAQIGIYESFDQKPDYVISGINDGANVGHAHILSSGTVGAALEAAIQGVPAFASSVWGIREAHPGIDFNGPEASALFAIAAKITRRIIHEVMEKGFPDGIQVVCINIPHNATEDAEIVIAQPHTNAYGRLFEETEDGSYKNGGNSELRSSDETESDLFVLTQGKVSVVPISVQLSSQSGQEKLAEILQAPIAR